MTLAFGLCVALWLSPSIARQSNASVTDKLGAKLEELDRANPARTRELASELIALGDEAATAALAQTPEAFAALAIDARRARSQIACDAGGPRAIAGALQRLGDLDENVRRNLLQLIASPEQRETLAGQRIAALEAAALGDASVEIRAAAIRGLARLDSLEACAALERCMTTAGVRESVSCAQALAAQPRARDIVVRRVQRALTGDPSVDDGALPVEALEALLEAGYGSALAETPSGGEAALDRVPFVQGAQHAVPGVRAAAATALQRFVDRARVLGDWRRADAVLAGLIDRGLNDYELLVERARLALQAGDDPKLARQCAAEIRRRWPLDGDLAHREQAAMGALLEAVAALALADHASVEPALAAATDALDSLRGEQLGQRIDDKVWFDAKGRKANPDREGVQHLVEARTVAARSQLQVTMERAVVEIYRVLAALAAGRDTADGGVLARAREADILLLEAQYVASSNSPARLSLDDLLTHPMGPSQLLFLNRRGGALSTARALELERALVQAFASVTGGIAGFEPAPDLEPRLARRTTDAERRDWLERIQRARFDYDDLDLKLKDEQLDNGPARDDNARRELLRWRELVRREHLRESNEGDVALERQIEPSQAGLVLADRLRDQGHAEAARALAVKVREGLEAVRDSFANERLAQRVLASAETTLGGALMDANTPAEAEQSFQAALARLEAIEKDPATRADERWLSVIRSQISNVLVSLAVNANVKLRRPDKALEYFERAYGMQQSDFMRVLLACYRARAGRVAEARAALREVPISPGNYYNLGCTYALLGERELALDFLRRDLDEYRGNGGSRERQKEWARGDPDLESLRDDPRFQAMMRPADKGADE